MKPKPFLEVWKEFPVGTFSIWSTRVDIFELRNHTHVEETSAEFCLIAKTTGAAWRAVSSIYQITRSERDILCAAVSRTFNREALVVPPARTASPDVYSHPDDVANTAKKTNDHIKSTYIAKKIYVNLCPDNRGSSLTKPTGRQQRPAMEPESQ